ncbi:DUF397 domain-containing protein [Streptomyces sp. DSM 44917]|uniref:DUF397 domain-containing protein n=1 Tax=Streptomyces boetiae TaxID=3075541 RepID=A0ABU2L9W2_9ACTN|nr:DUF397 domain-containing protein [Streptomyces sp. DSM 44917]MDT0308003.1 DUF397 domain-containing protein [Streptomyces sp. DSM 44917]
MNNKAEVLSWRKSSYSNGDGACVEVAVGLRGVVPVRDSKCADDPSLTVTTRAWTTFIASLRDAG